jgi:hypothetical protein
MDYTSLALVKQEIISGGVPSISSQFDALITRLISAASADIEEYCTQTRQPNCANYFKSESVADEILRGIAYVPDGNFVIWPHKPYISSVSAISYRVNPTHQWETADVNNVEIQGTSVLVWEGGPSDQFQVKVSYVGGLGADLASLPASLIEAATVLAARYFKEASTGLPDTIGLSDIGVLTYSKTMPIRVKASLDRLKRVVPW